MPSKSNKSSKKPLVSKKSGKSKTSSKKISKIASKNNCISSENNLCFKKVLFTSIIISIISIAILSYLFYYLHNLQKCDCFQDENKNNEYTANINYLMIIEGILIIMKSIILISLVSWYITLDKQNAGSYSSGKNTMIYLLIILYLLIYGLFVYNVYKLNKNINHDCECAKHPIRFILYLQAIGMIIYILLLIYLGLNLFMHN